MLRLISRAAHRLCLMCDAPRASLCSLSTEFPCGGLSMLMGVYGGFKRYVSTETVY